MPQFLLTKFYVELGDQPKINYLLFLALRMTVAERLNLNAEAVGSSQRICGPLLARMQPSLRRSVLSALRHWNLRQRISQKIPFF